MQLAPLSALHRRGTRVSMEPMKPVRQQLINDVVVALKHLHQLDEVLQNGGAAAIERSFIDTLAALSKVRNAAMQQTESIDVSLIEHVSDKDANDIDGWLQAQIQAVAEKLAINSAKSGALATLARSLQQAGTTSGGAAAGGAATEDAGAMNVS